MGEAVDILFLGTGAAEGSPAIYCGCEFCNHVRSVGGPDQRTRSALRIGRRYQIDFGPDTAWQLHREGLSLLHLEHLLITHTHSDHFQFEELVSKSQARIDNGKPLHLYMSEPAAQYLDSIYHTFDAQIEEEADLEAFRRKYPVHPLAYFRSYEIGELQVQTLKGSHLAEGEQQYACSYLIRLPDGRRLLYAVDTGYFLEESWAFMASRQADILIMDCTNVGEEGGQEQPFGHHTLSSFLSALRRMRSSGFLGERSAVYATHFNPHQGLYHRQIQQRFDESGFRVTAAWDGLRI